MRMKKGKGQRRMEMRKKKWTERRRKECKREMGEDG